MENGFQKIKRLLCYHWAAIVCAVVFVVLLATPFICSRILLGSEFQGIESEVTDDEAFYLSRIQDVIDGYPMIGNSYLAEHKNAPPQQLFVPEYVLAQLTRLTGFVVPYARIFIAALLECIVFLLFYSVALKISESKTVALFSSLFFFFGLYPTAMMRPVSPQLNGIFWFFAVLALWCMLDMHIMWRRLVMASIAIGLLFYIYPYYWTWFIVFLVILIGTCWLRERRYALACLVTLAGVCIIGSGYGVLTYSASRSPEYVETMTRLGMIATRFPSGAVVLMITSISLGILLWLLRSRVVACNRGTLFFIAAFLTSMIVVNQHIITGKNFEFSNHYTMQTISMAIFAFGFVWRHLAYKYRHYALIIGAIVTVSFVVVGSGRLLQQATTLSPQMAYRQDYAPVFQWLREHASNDAVVYANEDLSYWIPVYTSQNVFFSHNAGLFLVSDTELENRFLAQHFFDGIDERLIRDSERVLFGIRYVDQQGHVRQQNKLRKFFGITLLPYPLFPETEIQRITEIGHSMQRKSFREALQPYEVNYFVWDSLANPQWKLQNQSWLIPVFHYKQFTIFMPKPS